MNEHMNAERAVRITTGLSAVYFFTVTTVLASLLYPILEQYKGARVGGGKPQDEAEIVKQVGSNVGNQFKEKPNQ